MEGKKGLSQAIKREQFYFWEQQDGKPEWTCSVKIECQNVSAFVTKRKVTIIKMRILRKSLYVNGKSFMNHYSNFVAIVSLKTSTIFITNSLCFRDYAKAFDKLRYKEILELLCWVDIFRMDIKITHKLYWQRTICIRL